MERLTLDRHFVLGGQQASNAGALTLRQRQRRFGFAALAPALVVLLAVLAYPILASVWLSLNRVSLAEGRFDQRLTGLANFAALFSDRTFRAAFTNSIVFVAVEIVAVTLLSLAFASLLNRRNSFTGFARTILVIPWAIAPVANAVLWKWILNANYGVLNAIVKGLGLTDSYVIWLGTPRSAMAMLLLVDIWKSVPFITLLLLAGLQKIPKSLYRAARIDGAGGRQLFWYITLPSLRTTIATAVVLQTVWSLRIFDLIYVLTRGGPADGTVMLNYLSYRETFNFLHIGYGAAIADVLFFLTLALAILYIRLLKPKGAGRSPA